jgi:ATP-binding cassette, subfamily C, bacterial CydD
MASEKLTRKQFGDLKRMSAFFLDSLQGLTTLKLLNQSRKQTEQIAWVGENYRKTTMDVLRLTFLSALTLEWLATLSVAVIAVEIGVRLLSGNMAFEQAFFILVIAPEFYLPLRMVGLRFHASASGVAAAKNIFLVLDEPPMVVDMPAAVLPLDFELKPPFQISFENIDYFYTGRQAAALENVSFVMKAGLQTALVGKSGAGKSTAANLVLGLIQPSSGKISINGKSLAELPLDWWQSNLAWVPQQPYLFNTSIKENILISKPEASLEEIWRAVKLANLEDLVKSLSAGLDTQIGEKGARLSGGQAQRVALARAFLRDAQVVIMDEPTAHLDPEQEGLLVEATRRLCQGRTVLTIAHRLATVIGADQIIVLEDGRVTECGNHAALINQQGFYQKLVSAYQGVMS